MLWLPARSALVAQVTDFSIPPSAILSNYDRIAIGQREGLEGGAFVARTDDAGAGWYNPAGLALSDKSGLNASSNAYELTSVTLEGVGTSKGSTRFSPSGNYFGAVLGAPIIKSPNIRLAFFYAKPVSWNPSLLDGAFSRTPGGNTEQFSYSSTSVLSTIIAGPAAGFRVGDRWRVGASVALGMTSMRQVQSLSDQLITPGVTTTTGLRNVSSDAHTNHLLLSGGFQWDVASKVHVGGSITTPGLRLGGSSKLLYSNSLFSSTVLPSGEQSREIGFRDEKAHFEYKLPLEVIGGVAVQLGKFEFEGDVRYHGGTSQYTLLSSQTLAQLITTDPAGIPTQSTLTFVPVKEQAQSVVNVLIGGNYAVSRGFRIHGGFFSDGSPVDHSASSNFRSVDLYGGSAGVSFGASHLSGSLGVAGSWGTTDNRAVGPSLGGIQGETKVKVSTITLLYAVSYNF
jgi:hypothetical protein